MIDGSTELTTRPFLPAMYGVEMGDADCYSHTGNRGERDTLADSTGIAEGSESVASRWVGCLSTTAYGCSYTDLPGTGGVLGVRASSSACGPRRT